jgi:hypothetical protein
VVRGPFVLEDGGPVIAITQVGQKGGREARWAQKVIIVGLRIGPCAGV